MQKMCSASPGLDSLCVTLTWFDHRAVFKELSINLVIPIPYTILKSLKILVAILIYGYGSLPSVKAIKGKTNSYEEKVRFAY